MCAVSLPKVEGMGDLAYTEPAEGEFIALSSSTRGKLFKKHILTKGTLHYNARKIRMDDRFFQALKRNFDAKVCPIVQVPVVNDQNQHSEDPLRNIGEVVGLSIEGDKLYATIDVRDEQAAQKIEDRLLIGVSAMLSMDYLDTRDGSRKGPTLLHTAITNRPHAADLEEYELLAMSADSSERAVLLTASPKETRMDLEDLIAILADEHQIDLPALQATAAQHETVAALSAAVRETVAGSDIVKLSADASGEDVAAAVKTIIDEHIALTAQVAEATAEAERVAEEAKQAAAAAEIDALIKEGRILPAKRERQLELLLSNEEIFRDLLPDESIVKLSGEEQGVEPADEAPERTLEETVEAEIARYAESAKSVGINVA